MGWTMFKCIISSIRFHLSMRLFLNTFFLDHVSPSNCCISRWLTIEPHLFIATHTFHVTLVNMHHLTLEQQIQHDIKTEEHTVAGNSQSRGKNVMKLHLFCKVNMHCCWIKKDNSMSWHIHMWQEAPFLCDFLNTYIEINGMGIMMHTI